jgi:hypothetical protein
MQTNPQPFCPHCQITLTEKQVDDILLQLNRKKLQDLWTKLEQVRIRENWQFSLLNPVQPSTTQEGTSSG